MIHPGQKLVVQDNYGKIHLAESKPVTPSKTIEKPVADSNIHVVSTGQTLEAIAGQYNISAEILRKWNDLTSDSLHPGQKLFVKEPQVIVAVEEKPSKNIITSEEYIYHIVRKGDTLWDIAKKYEGTTVEQIKQLNNITNTKKLQPGQKLRVSKKG